MTIENENYNVALNDFPLYIDPADIFKVYVRCLSFVENDLFEIVHEKNMKPQNISISDLIKDGISPRVSSKSKHGICLRSNINLYTQTSNLKKISSFDLNNLPRKIKIIKSIDDPDCFCLVPTEDLFLFEYKLLAEVFFYGLPLKN